MGATVVKVELKLATFWWFFQHLNRQAITVLKAYSIKTIWLYICWVPSNYKLKMTRLRMSKRPKVQSRRRKCVNHSFTILHSRPRGLWVFQKSKSIFTSSAHFLSSWQLFSKNGPLQGKTVPLSCQVCFGCRRWSHEVFHSTGSYADGSWGCLRTTGSRPSFIYETYMIVWVIRNPPPPQDCWESWLVDISIKWNPNQSN